MAHTRLLLIGGGVAGVLLLAACGESLEVGEAASGAPAPQVDASPSVDVPSGLDWVRGLANGEGLPQPLVPLGEIRSGGPPPDGIPPIDAPRFLPAAEVAFLADHEPVLALEVEGEARAYPVQILIWHEIVNDTVGGVPVAITYCPLCNTAVAYDRRLDDRVLSFGTSGMLWNSALVMYDRQTETLWGHVTGEGIVGALTGAELETLPVATVSWSDWRDANPDGLVLSRDTGHDRDYGRNPYPGYDDVRGEPFLFEGEVDGRLTAMTRVVGIESDGDAVAVPLVQLAEERVVPVDVGGRSLVVLWEPGTASALDRAEVAAGADVGASGVFAPEVAGRPLTFEATGGGFRDVETGSTWDVLGRATAGPLAGSTLARAEHVDTFWFAWAAFRPDTTLVS